jgi:hypothetical protein
MDTHYVRQRTPFHSKLQSPLESLVYHATPEKRLVVFEQILDASKEAALKAGEPVPSHKAVAGILASLTERGFIKELYGVKLERLLASA